ncbi:hypothetical protein L1O03_02940 [Corynebacterium uropygiale]|uniref:Uncharacterized protein n=1 Tax=Corynebacterium uropygiale TaxID=1775911 RepID=A0A9X1QRB7_9CORY|nr:hypothetical protein [Corynebacterium uropygiale]MCF4006134.1 hypothetical protein [Corynebacterium uropygiale]
MQCIEVRSESEAVFDCVTQPYRALPSTPGVHDEFVAVVAVVVYRAEDVFTLGNQA